MPKLIAMGEMLIDFVATERGVTLAEAEHFTKAAGGAPANVAVAAAKLGISSGFLGKVGDDPFGHFLVDTLRNHGVDSSAIRYSQQARTGLAFVSLKADGDRDFVFFRHPSADMRYAPDEIDLDYLASASILHLGSLGLAASPMHEAMHHAIESAQKANVRISYDPNLRLSLWPNEEVARREILSIWPAASIIKISREELTFLSGAAALEASVRTLWHDNLQLMAVTDGPAGCTLFTAQESVSVPGFSVPVADTTGAGDAFAAALLSAMLREEPAWHDLDALAAMGRYANAVGALTTTAHGAIPALPSAALVASFLATARADSERPSDVNVTSRDPRKEVAHEGTPS
ncbi:MAG: hypothetical protein KDD73_09980 [Anaerolineales bacterium]|nr:hypothetical protein [Anaerolineales bacterium]MCB9127682.1 fructokinase [Ardenticatenales bacterium]